ncbi:hypothetical protein DdX_13781 [Ditylenchus destructor]|uniref:BURP domain-containing protein n=1 Tax=Ditylenchus destructor TaxID=166010 RepID=A0AAD4MUL8_9BILA|nr:hypothetical protein DdX_13781 [Ditylenchus destructor]
MAGDPRSVPVFHVLDYRQIAWPPVERAEMPYVPNRAYMPISCYTEMDETFISEKQVYRLDTSNKVETGPCLIRIPTNCRITFNPLRILHNETYMRVITGNAIFHAPLATPKIRGVDTDNYGPWHIPCKKAYLIFKPYVWPREGLEFTLTPEEPNDVPDPREHLCGADGMNYAEMDNYKK